MPLDEKEPLKERENVSSEDDFESDSENWKLNEKITVRTNRLCLYLDFSNHGLIPVLYCYLIKILPPSHEKNAFRLTPPSQG